jgi:hypothetical protein
MSSERFPVRENFLCPIWSRRAAVFSAMNYTYVDHRSGREVDADEALDRNGILRDGYGLRVPVTLMDSLQQQMHQHFRPAWEDARHSQVTALDGSPAGHRPGFVSKAVPRARLCSMHTASTKMSW